MPGIKLRIFYSNTKLNYKLSQKLKLLRNVKLIHLTTFLTSSNFETSKNKNSNIFWCFSIILADSLVREIINIGFKHVLRNVNKLFK